MSMPTVFPARCAACRQPSDRAGAALCATCRFALSTSPATIVPIPALSGSASGGITAGGIRAGGITAALSFDGTVRSAVLALKFRNRRTVAAALADVLVRRLGLDREPASAPGGFDLVTWAPTSRSRSVERGFDQAELLARAVGRRLGVPCRRLLYREHGAPQTGRSRAERLMAEQAPSFRVRPLQPLRVLVVDDVVTTGATLAAAGEALLAAGIAEVRLVAVAATPARAHAKAREQAPGRLESA